MKLKVTITGYIDVEEHMYDDQGEAEWASIEQNNMFIDPLYANDVFSDLEDRTFTVEEVK